MDNDRAAVEAVLTTAKRTAMQTCESVGGLLSHERFDELGSVLDGQLRIAAQLAKLKNELFG
ncbi:hypothetical protein SAMN02910447_02403 [Ruminococcus sp. YE71]|uniref:hypothetical protein n=1 Tax=unclassified Ruminococcus TaxID=2608920 RepID=UPI00088C7349|nr:MULTISPECIES: hypothetical protein [unclassified Ruminococcus]SDA23932.1 hypothetical protein SAMN02910446_02270 [Ruminococcus sp. YE78]SFW40729.1 hypothetical protein SAMN02910447_02403 [Ruminococcus sp. YE71]